MGLVNALCGGLLDQPPQLLQGFSINRVTALHAR
jgi:hypothetical protein